MFHYCRYVIQNCTLHACTTHNKFQVTYISGGGVDYDFGPSTVTFPAGVTSISFDVPIIDDNILEDDETFNIILSTSLSDRISIGTPSQAIITIQGNDRK